MFKEKQDGKEKNSAKAKILVLALDYFERYSF
jgi:hypothetical protein